MATPPTIPGDINVSAIAVSNEIRMTGSTSGTLTHTVPSVVTPYTLTWPSTVAASNGQVLSSTTGGSLSWETAAGVPLGTMIISPTSSITGYTNIGELESQPVQTGFTAMPVPIWGSAYCTVGTSIYIFGGKNSSYTTLATLYRFDPTGNAGLGSWTALTSNGTGAFQHVMVSDGGDFLYATQGNVTSGFFRYSISGNSWTTLTSSPFNSAYTMGYFLNSVSGNTWGNDRIYIIGQDSWAFYNVGPNTWSSIGSTSPFININDGSGAGIGSKLWAVGGSNLTTVFYLDVLTSTVTQSTALNYVTYSNKCCAIGTKIYSFGGTVTPPPPSISPVQSIETSLLINNTVLMKEEPITITLTMQPAVAYVTLSGIPYIYVFGGFNVPFASPTIISSSVQRIDTRTFYFQMKN